MVADYLASRLNAPVEIKSIDFSIFGNVSIEGLSVSDPNHVNIFSVRRIATSTNPLDIIAGDYIFDSLHIEGVTGQLIERDEGLNIQFIIDAFRSRDDRPAAGPNPLNLYLYKLWLEDINFRFTSSISGMQMDAHVGKFASENSAFTQDPNKITAEKVDLHESYLNILSFNVQDSVRNTATKKNDKPADLDFGMGIIFDIREVLLADDDFSFHRNEVAITPKFDPRHLALKKIQLHLSDIIIRQDSLGAVLKNLSLQLPKFQLTDSRGEIHAGRNQFSLSEIHFAAGSNMLDADLKGSYDLNSPPDEMLHALEIQTRASAMPRDIAYFFNDSLTRYFRQWSTATIDIDAAYSMGIGNIEKLHLGTANSQLLVRGTVRNVPDLERMSWNDVVINTSMGSDFGTSLQTMFPKGRIPPGATVQLSSDGDINNINAKGQISSPWGTAIAAGQVVRRVHGYGIDVNLTGEKVDIGSLLNSSPVGRIDATVDAKGVIGNNQGVEVNGLIQSVEVLGQPMHKIAFQWTVQESVANGTISIHDPNYHADIISMVSFKGPLTISNELQLEDFSIGRLMRTDSTLLFSGNLNTKITLDQPSIDGFVRGRSISFRSHAAAHSIDTLAIDAQISPTASQLNYFSDFGNGHLTSNFDARDCPLLLKAWSDKILNRASSNLPPTRNRLLNFSFQSQNASPLQLLGINVNDFSALRIAGEFDEQAKAFSIQATTEKFNGFGFSMDTLRAQLISLRDSLRGEVDVRKLAFGSIKLGDMDIDLHTNADSTVSTLALSRDSTSMVYARALILPTDSGTMVYPDKLSLMENQYFIDRKHPVLIGNNNVAWENFVIARDSMEISLRGDLNEFDLRLRNVDLTPLTRLVYPDTTVIHKGQLSGSVSYSRGQRLDFTANIDSLGLYGSSPLTLAASGKSSANHIPFKFLLTNAKNKVDLNGIYSLENDNVDATLQLDVDDVGLFTFLVSDFIDEMNGAIKGNAIIKGPLTSPVVNGQLGFHDVALTTVNPKLTFNVQDDVIRLDSSSLIFNNFTLFDRDHNPLKINGRVKSDDFRSFGYDLKINSQQYNLLNKPDTTSGILKGSLVIDSDIQLKGNGKDTKVDANVTVDHATHLIYVASNDEIELLKTEGIIDFVDHRHLQDSLRPNQGKDFYDSLIASLPNFNLNSKVTIENGATVKVIIDEQSGDFIEASGVAELEFGYDRTKNIRLSGNYTVRKGVYRLSFYDLVKRNFQLLEGSSIHWNGSPQNGDLDIKALHTVESNSIGLIGHEIGENEKSVYKRSLNYLVGINIRGTIEKPVVSFSLDLPPEEKANYPVLANKLDRLKSPEFESELNKQVFGLLVLGGFLPETGGSDVNSSLIATTALSNSVNSLLASQLNRFASQYVKGVSIDVGIQSYSDYSAPGGKTQTAMDFRVSKSIMDDRLSFEIGGDFDINQDQSGANTGNKNYRGDIAIVYDLTGNGDKKVKLFNNETYDIIYQEIRNSGISLIFIREFSRKEKK